MPKNSVSFSKSMFEAIDQHSRNKGVSKSGYVSDILKSVGLPSGAFKPIVLQVPTELTQGNRDALDRWLKAKSAALLNHYYSEKP